MEKKTFIPEPKDAFPGLSIGLLIADTAAERLCMVALLCRNPMINIVSSLLIKAPLDAVNESRKRDSARRMRFCEPLVGEAFDFAQRLSGGLAIRRNDMCNDSAAPAVVIIKRVATDQWSPAFARSQQWASGCQKVFPQLIKRTALQQAKLSCQPGEMSDPELDQFRAFVLSVTQEMRFGDKSLASKIDTSAAPERMCRPAP